MILEPELGEGWFSLIPAKRKFFGTDWTGISDASRAGVDLLAQRKIPDPALNKFLIFSQ